MVQKEIRLRVMGSNTPVRSAYIIDDNREFYNCGDKGHLTAINQGTIMVVGLAHVEAMVEAVVVWC
jgi:hypothetical protein